VTAMLERPAAPDRPSQDPERRRRARGVAPWLMSAAVALAAILAAANIHGVIEHWSWLWPVIVTVLAVEAGTGLARAMGWSPVAGTLLGLAGLVGSVTALFLSPTSVLGVIPGPGSLRALEFLVADAQDSVISQVAPVVASPGIIMVACVGVGLVALLVDTMAVPLQLPAASGFGLLAILVVPAIIKPGSLGPAGFIAAAAGYLAILAAAQWLDGLEQAPPGRTAAGQFGRAAGIGAGALALALLLPPGIPGFTTGAFPQGSRLDWLGAPTGLNPIVSLGDNLRRPGAFGRITYAPDSKIPLYLRTVTLENLTGARWSPTDSRGQQREGVEEMGTPRIRELLEDGNVTTTAIETRSFTSPWLPAPYAPAEISGVDGDWSWDPRTLAVQASLGTTSANQDYVVRSVTPVLTREALQDAQPLASPAVDGIFTSLPPDMPDIIVDATEEVLDGLSDPYDQAMAIQNYLRGPGFVYSEQAPVDGGYDQSGFEVVAAFLQKKAGYCVHYASTMAIMAREAGIPSRIAVGYAPGRETGETVEVDGRKLTEHEVDSRDAHAWPELYFDDLGWVAFEPTPGRGAVPAYAQQPAAPAPDQAERENLNPGGNPAPTLPPLPRALGSGGGSSGTEDTPATGVWTAAGPGILLLALAAPGLIRRSRTRRRRNQLLAPDSSGRGTALIAWREVRDAAADYGVSAAPEESARAFERRLGQGLDADAAAALSRLRRDYEVAAYANPAVPRNSSASVYGAGPAASIPPATNEAVRRQRWADVETVTGGLRRRGPWRQRVLGLLFPRSLFIRR
jgi:transglutaminase-like putative cysteine protease